MDKCQAASQSTAISLSNDITIKRFMLYGAYGPGLPCVLMCVSGAVQVGVVQSKSPEGGMSPSEKSYSDGGDGDGVNGEHQSQRRSVVWLTVSHTD